MANASYEEPWYEHPKELEKSKRQQAELEERYALVDSLEAGAISGGQIVYDAADVSTHWLSPSKEERDFAKDFYGVMAPEDPDNANPGSLYNEGLSRSEKNALKDLAHLEVFGGWVPEPGVDDGFNKGGVHKPPRDFFREDKEHAALAKEAATLWPEFAMSYPDLAADQVGAMAAMQRMIATSGLSKADMKTLAQSDRRGELIDRIAKEQYSPGSESGYENLPNANSWEDDYRTGGISGGYEGGSRRSAPEEKAGSVKETLGNWQRRTGFVR